jgi:hypothetical protein
MPKMIICYSKIARKPQRNLFQRDFENDIEDVINSKELIERYGRKWRFSKWEKRDGYLLGKFGFVASVLALRLCDRIQPDFCVRLGSLI